jgi:hypothetical protein
MTIPLHIKATYQPKTMSTTEAQGPTDNELADLLYTDFTISTGHGTREDPIGFARAVLARWGTAAPKGLIPMEYVDSDGDCIRIQSEPSEDGGGCWVVRNSRFVNPCREFPSPEAAYEEHSARKEADLEERRLAADLMRLDAERGRGRWLQGL